MQRRVRRFNAFAGLTRGIVRRFFIARNVFALDKCAIALYTVISCARNNFSREGINVATFLKNINAVSRASTQFLDETLSGRDVKGFQCKYILTVCNNAGVSQDKIAKLMFVNKSNVARQLGDLEERGYIERRQSEEDKRILLVYPTEKAIEFLPEIRAANARWRSLITSGFTDEEKEALFLLTDKLYKNAAAYLGEEL